MYAAQNLSGRIPKELVTLLSPGNETRWLTGVKRKFSMNIPLRLLNFEPCEYIAYLKIK